MASLAVLSLFDFARFSHPLKNRQTRFSHSVRRHSHHYLIALVLLSCVVVLNPTSTWAQSTSTGTVVGLVTDPTGAIVPEATVSLIDHTTGTTKTTTTNEAGRYIFVNVNPGTYDITVNKTGFTQARFQKQEVSIGRQLTVDATLKVGTATQEVVVEASGTTLQTLNSTVGTTIGQQSLQELPNLSRDVSSLLALQPAIAPNGSVAGTVRDQTTFQLDGGNNTNDMDGTMNTYTGSFAATGGVTGVMPTPVESIEEFKVNVANQTADFNGSAGAQIQMVTRRGGSSWHGALYEYYLGSNFGANTWLNNHTPTKDSKGNTISPTTKLPSNHYNRFGASAGGPVGPEFWGGKTYVFANYEGRRYPQNTTVEKRVPSALLRAGVVQVQDANGKFQPYNLNPFPVTVNGVTYQPAQCPQSSNGLCDPRGFGLNSLVSKIWNTQMPMPNDFTSAGGDTFNTQGYLTSLTLPQNDNFGVIRLDHSVGNNWHLMSSYRYYHLERAVNNQFDIGGVLGGTLGVAKSTANRPQVPWFYVLGVTTNISPRLTNDFRYSFLRNFWEWKTANAPPQLPGLGGALEIGGEACSNTGGNSALIPYCVRTQDARQRYWNGKDHVFRDDLSLASGNHIFQFGGQYERNWDAHRRNDNGQGIMAAYVYQVGASSGSSAVGFTVTPPNPANPSSTISYVPAGIPTGQVNNYKNLYAQVLGIVTQPQTLFTRSVSDLSLEPFGQPVIAHSITNSYNVYFSDSWHMHPNFTLTYGLGYQLEMPPFEEDGKQVMLVDQNGKPIVTKDYLAKRKAAALAGNTTSPDYDPIMGFATIKNVAGRKYPYDTFYGGVSPRIAAAWNPRFNGGILGSLFGENKTVLRGGWGRMYGRANGVLNILTPLLAPGLLQAVSCQGAVFAPVNNSQCLGTGGANPATAFRIGTDGLVAPLPTAVQKLPQPFLPGVGGNALAGDSSAIDPKFRPNRVDSFDFTIQRELTSKATIEVGYIGRIIRNELQNIDLDAVPYMTTLNGQSFAQAYAGLYTAICGLQGGACANNTYTGPAQPFFEAALGGPTSAFCTGSANCTQAVIKSQGSNLKLGAVYDLWSALSKQGAWTLGRSLPSSVFPGTTTGSQLTSITMSTSLGYGNYNAGFVSFRLRDFHGLTGTSNFTYGKALGTGAVTQSTSSFSVIDPWNLRLMYGPNGGNGRGFDTKFLFNQSLVYHLPFYKEQQGFLGRVLGGWGVAPLFTAQSGVPLQVQIGSGGNCQSFGEGNCASIGTNENAVRVGPVPSLSLHHGVVSSGACGSSGNTLGVNAFADPQAVCNSFRRLILGVDTNGGGVGRIKGFPRWNMDMSITKETKLKTERDIGFTFYALFTNVLNHFQPGDPAMDIDNPSSWGVVTQQDTSGSGGYGIENPRQLELGLRIHF
jgi:Carboxypeptidase regulatory-like domain